MVERLGSETVRQWVQALAGAERALSDSERIDLLRSLEELKSAAAAAQAEATADFDRSQRELQAAAGVPARLRGRGVAEQVALARRDSPFRGGQHLGLAHALTREMPWTMRALKRGVLSERRATLLVRETAYLSREHRSAVDRELVGPGAARAVESMGDKELVSAAQRIAYRLDPQSVVARARRAAAQRTVTLRPAPDTMSYLTGLLPVAQGVACMAVLTRAAEAARAAGDARTRGQVMADTLVAALAAHGGGLERAGRPLTWAAADSARGGATDSPRGASGAGAAAADADALDDAPAGTDPVAEPGPAATAPATAVMLHLVVTDRTLFQGDQEPAHLIGYGTVPAPVVRDMVRDTEAAVWVRRLYTHPTTGALLAADSASRLFRGGLREVLVARDQRCRTPWCDAPVRHADHVTPHASGGPTSSDNGQGRCERCNYAKEAFGWFARATGPPEDRHTVTIVTPTGHRYTARAPAPPGTLDGEPDSTMEARLEELLRAS